MRTPVCFALILGVVAESAFLTHAVAQEAEKARGPSVDFIVEARPASLFIVTEGKKFESNGTKLSTLYYMPNVDAGVGLGWDRLYLDLTAGAGMLVNDGFRSAFLQASAAAAWAIDTSFSLGPRVGLIHLLNPEWLEDDSAEFDGKTGWMAGLQMSIGERISYIVSADLISAKPDVQGVPNRDKLDLTGIALQFGVRGEF